MPSSNKKIIALSETSYYKVLAKDTVLKKIMHEQGELYLESQPYLYWILIKSIVSQQISTKVAAIIYERLCALFADFPPDFETILETPTEMLRSVGLSARKVTYIYNIIYFFKENHLTDTGLQALSDAAIMRLLTQIKGIGKWTVHMLLMFALERPDIFPQEDFGIQKAMMHYYSIPSELSKKERIILMEDIAEKWRPYQTYACRYLWNAISATGNW